MSASVTDPVADGPAASWPPQFSTTFIAQARALLTVRHVLVVIGPTGGSRNDLAAEIAEAPPGPVWFRHVARFGEDHLRYFALSQIFRPLSTYRADTHDSWESAVRRELERLDVHLPTLIVANADRCDPESIDVLMRIAATGDVGLVATLPADTVGDRQSLVDVAEIIELPPLSPATIAELMRVRFGATPHPALAELIAERSDGAYSMVREIADAAQAEGLLLLLGDSIVLDPAKETDQLELLARPVTVWTEEALDGPDQLVDLVHLTAILGQVDLDDAEECLSRDSIDTALSHGSITIVDDAITFVAKAEGVLVLRSLDRSRQVELFERYATRVPRTLRRPASAVAAADWWRAAEQLLPPMLAELAARQANLVGRHRRALLFTDADQVDAPGQVALLERVFALIEAGERRELHVLLASLDPAALTEAELLVYGRWVMTLPDDDDRSQRISRAVSAADADSAKARATVLALSGLVDRATGEGGAQLTGQLRSLTFSSHLSPLNRAMAFSALSAVLRHSALPGPAVQASEFALELLDEAGETASTLHLSTARDFHVLALIAALDLDGADQAIGTYFAASQRHLGSGRMMLGLEALIALIRGDTDQALTQGLVALEATRHHDSRLLRGWLEALVALCHARQDRPAEAARLLRASQEHSTPREHWDLQRRIGHAGVLDALGEPEEALELLAEVMREADSRQMLLSQIEAAVLSVQIGGPVHLPALLELVDGLVEPTGTPAAWQAFARAAHVRDVAGLTAVADDLDDRGAHLYAEGVAQYVLDTNRRKDDLDAQTRDHLESIRARPGHDPT